MQTLLTKRSSKRVAAAVVSLAEAKPEGYISSSASEFRNSNADLRTAADAPRVTKAAKSAASELARRKLNQARGF
jgi:hypothetical protein